ncbi:MAG: acyl carrier protein [Clostridiales bacterium]|nr:acyl carrier protein [Clostridiales bacterium]
MKRNLGHEIVQIARDAVGVELSVNESLKESGLDSLSLVSVIALIEEKYGIVFSDDDLDPAALTELSDLVRITERHL